MAEENNALFKEIEEDLRQDRTNQLWKKYGKFLIGGVVILIGSVAIFQGWEKYTFQDKMNRSETFYKAQTLIDEGGIEKAILALDSFSTKKNDGYAKLAKFKSAALSIKSKDIVTAISIYRELSNDSQLESYYRELAVILGAMAQLDPKVDSRDLIEKTELLNLTTNTWRHSAREILGLSALKNNDKEQAKVYFTTLMTDPTTPPSMASRGEKMLNFVN